MCNEATGLPSCYRVPAVLGNGPGIENHFPTRRQFATIRACVTESPAHEPKPVTARSPKPRRPARLSRIWGPGFRRISVAPTHELRQHAFCATVVAGLPSPARARSGSGVPPIPEQLMVPRYSRPAMVALWEPEAKYRIWFEIEAHATEKLGELGVVPESAAKALWDWWRTGPAIDVAAIDAIEAVTKHDVIAFLTWVAQQVGDEARYMHQGMTSSDVLDTTLAVQLARSADILLEDLDQLLAALKRRALEHKLTPTIGRSHGIHAEPVTFGFKLAQAHAEFARGRERLVAARAEIATCAISGAVGTFANIDPAVEEHVAEAMGLAVEPISTQVIPRDRHAMFFATLGVIASSIERLATEVRHLQRTEVLEAEEYFSPGQKGSSAMPHKRNPVLTENLTGLARVVRSAVTPAMENVALWHERDIFERRCHVTAHHACEPG